MTTSPHSILDAWSDPELRALGSLVAAVAVWLFLGMRLTDGGVPVDVPVRHLVFTYVAVVVAMIVLTATLASALEVRRTLQGRLGEVESDERDLAIEARAERVEGWVSLAGINVLVVQAIGSAAYGYGRSLPPDLTSPSALVFALLTVAFAAHVAKQTTVLWLYRR